ncbi:MAG: Do family serine endopeptidase [bacterium]|nr:Do family serine endopeptidase [Myxococcales bacterium]MCB9551067.1 Do family serine endopeptidase [Myxococcales bacterium]
MPITRRSLTRAGLALALASAAAAPALAAPPAPKATPAGYAVPAALAAIPGDVSLPDIAERAVQSVVNISTRQSGRARDAMMDPTLRRFFRMPGPMPSPGGSMGSGVIVSDDGLVLTNNHVVEHGEQIEVTLSDGRDLPAELVGTDPKTDLAVIRITGDLTGLTPMPLGDSDALRLGESVLAIGNPFGLGHTVTLGIVSAKSRAGMGIVDYEDFIQTDAAINPGNSGGALVNMRGELVGINTAILSRTGGYQGVGFAIPTRMARTVMHSLVETGTVSRGWLGVGIQDLEPPLARALRLPAGTDGVLVTGVQPGTPAARAGLARGDVVIAIDGTPMRNAGQLRNTIALKGAVDVELTVLRDGRERSVAVTLGTLTEDGVTAAKPAGGEAAENTRLGLALRPLDRGLRERLGVADDVQGVMIAGVDPGSPADRAGLRPGDVIAEVEQRAVGSVRDFERRVDRADDQVLLLVRRGPGTLYVALEKPRGEGGGKGRR